MEVNEYQIGGNHYVKDYQHWDMVCDTDMPYLIAVATKYIDRWRDKNGVEDLRKSVHYLAKADELGIFMPKEPVRDYFRRLIRIQTLEDKQWIAWYRYLDQPSKPINGSDRIIMSCIVDGRYTEACKLITILINNETDDGSEPTSGYTNQDYIRG